MTTPPAVLAACDAALAAGGRVTAVENCGRFDRYEVTLPRLDAPACFALARAGFRREGPRAWVWRRR